MIEKKQMIEKGAELFSLFNSPNYSCAIAGGAIRDSILDKPISDIDFYIYSKNGMTPELFNLLIDNKYYNIFSGEQDYNTNVCVATCTNNEQDVNIMVIKTPITLYIQEYFDIGLCMCIANKHGHVFTSTAFRRDVLHKSITIYDRPSLPRYSLLKSREKHSKKIALKYPEYKIVEVQEKVYPLEWDNYVEHKTILRK